MDRFKTERRALLLCFLLFNGFLHVRWKRPIMALHHQALDVLGSPRAGDVIREVTCGLFRPYVEHGHQESPGRFDLVLAHEQRSVIVHNIPQECFVGIGGSLRKTLAIAEPHVYRTQVHLRSWILCLKTQEDALLRLNRDHESRWMPCDGRFFWKRLMRNAAKLDRNR